MMVISISPDRHDPAPDYFLWRYLKGKVANTSISILMLKNNIRKIAAIIPEVCKNIMKNMFGKALLPEYRVSTLNKAS